MVKHEAKIKLHELYPDQFPHPEYGDGDYPFKASDNWMLSFFERHGFSVRTIGKRMNKKGSTPEHIEKTREFHLDTRVFQVSFSLSY